MNQQPTSMDKTRSDNLLKTEDQEEVVLLLTFRHPVVKRERTGRLVSFFFNREDTKALMDLWLTGAPIPVSDIRDVHRAKRIFDQMVHGEC